MFHPLIIAELGLHIALAGIYSKLANHKTTESDSMPLLIFSMGLAILVWAVIALSRVSIFLSTAIFFVATCVFPTEFFGFDAGGLTWTLDRLWLLGMAGQVAIRWYRGELYFRCVESTDVAIVLFLMWLIARTITQPLGSVRPEQPATLMHLVNGYLIPVFLYAVLRTAKLDPAKLTTALWVIGGLGFYLGMTALLEVAGLWGLVFPRFIADPTLGIHFGRARGPMLQSVRLGMCLLACMVPLIIYALWLPRRKKYHLVLAFAGVILMTLAALITYTRSIWMGVAFVIFALVVLCLQGFPRRVVLTGMLMSGLAIGIVKGPDVVAFKRDQYSAAETRESTYMRAAFAYVSMEMFKDHPIAGFGFNQFQIYNRPYLADRSTDIRVESIRGYVHHNSYLSLLVDLGLVGFCLYLFAALAATLQAYELWRTLAVPQWARGLTLVALCIGGVHLIQMAFHEVSFSTIENSWLFAALGLVVAANQQFCRPGSASDEDVG